MLNDIDLADQAMRGVIRKRDSSADLCSVLELQGVCVRVLLVEDDVLPGHFTAQTLSRMGFVVDWEKSAAGALAQIARMEFDVILLDLGLPDLDGEEVIRKLRSRRSTIPIIVLTARGLVGDRVSMLNLGADDYLVKPYDLNELQARMRALRRRTASGDISDTQTIGPLVLHQSTRTATWQGKLVEVKSREFDLLEALVMNRPKTVSRTALERKLYGWNDAVESNAVEVYVHFLRRKFSPRLIVTHRGSGYRLATEAELSSDAVGGGPP